MAILFKNHKYERMLPKKAQAGILTTPTPSQADYNTRFGPQKYNNWEDVKEWNVGQRGKSAGWPGRDVTPLDDMGQVHTDLTNFYTKGATQFKDRIGPEAMTDISSRRKEMLAGGTNRRDMVSQLSDYARTTYGDQFIPKSDIYGSMDPTESAYAKEALRRRTGRRNLDPNRAQAGTTSTAGVTDVSDQKFGWRNFLSPKYITNQEGFRDIWDTPETKKVSYQERR